MKTKLIYCVLFVFVFGFGYSVSSIRWENKLLERETEIKNEYIEKQNKIVAEKDATINLLLEEGEIYFKRTSTMQSTIDRLQHNLKESSKRLSSTESSCHIDTTALRRCEELVSRGSELLGRCSSLLTENAIKHDALVKTIEDFQKHQ